jgi:patatin-like phospholipase/acyl hydrolase
MERCPRVLSLDGGGVRGLSSLLILKEIMAEIGRSAETQRDPLPCEYFDLIGGTSTGGLIALMLGRLRMVPRVSSRH